MLKSNIGLKDRGEATQVIAAIEMNLVVGLDENMSWCQMKEREKKKEGIGDAASGYCGCGD